MATRNIVPRANGEGSIGTAAKHWHEGHFDSVKLNGGDVGEYLAESTGYGIVSGCEPTISGLTVTVGAGVVHLADGTRKEIASTNITLDAADSTNPRIDLVYINAAGVVAKITGTAAASPSAPALPSGGISVCNVTIAAGAATGTLTENMDRKAVYQNLQIVSLSDYGSLDNENIDDTIARAIADIDGKRLILPLHIISTDTMIVISGHSCFEICGAGNAAMQDGYIDCSIKIENCMYFKINGIYARSVSRYNTFLVESCEQFSIDNCYIWGSGDKTNLLVNHEGLHIYQDCAYFRISSNYIVNNRLDGILVHNKCHDFIITNNHVRNCGAIGIEIEGRIGTNDEKRPCYNGTVTGNIILSSQAQGILCLFSREITILGNCIKDSLGGIATVGGRKIVVCGNSVLSKTFAFLAGAETFSLSNSENYTKLITVCSNIFSGRAGRPDDTKYGWDGMVSIRAAEGINFADNILMFRGAENPTGVQDCSYLSLAECIDINIVNNTMYAEDGREGDYPFWGIKLYDKTKDETTDTLYSGIGCNKIKILHNSITTCRHGVGDDVINSGFDANTLANSINDILIHGNYIKGVNLGVGIVLMYMSNHNYITIGYNKIRNFSEGANFYKNNARINQLDSLDVDTLGANFYPAISATATYSVGDKIYVDPTTNVLCKICTTSGTPGVWKSVSLT